MRLVRIVLPALSLAAAGLLVASPALAAPVGKIVEAKSADGSIDIIFTASDLPEGVGLDPASVTMSVGGEEVPTEAHRVAEETKPVERTALLAIDVSGSMENEPIEAAIEAALTYLEVLPADVKVGVVTFADEAQLAARPTTDRKAVRGVVEDLEARGGTALFDAVRLAATILGTSGNRNLLILSDGKDEDSTAKHADAVAALKDSGIQTDVVALGDSEEFLADLQAIAAAGNGAVFEARRTRDLAGAFSSAAQTIANQLLVTAAVPESASGTGQPIVVTAQAGDLRLTDEIFLTLSEATVVAEGASPYGPAPAPQPKILVDRDMVLLALGAVGAGLTVVLGVIFSGATASQRTENRVRRRLSLYTLTGRRPRREEEKTVLGSSQVAKSAVELAGRVIEKRDFEGSLARKLDAAAVPLKPAEWLLIHTGIALAGGLFFMLLGAGALLPALLGLFLGVVGPFLFLSLKESRRKASFAAQLADTLQLMAGSLSAGYSMPQAVDSVVREGNAPMSTEFHRALVETRLGVDVEDALDGVAERMDSKDFAWVVMAIRIQRQVGGNLAELLNTVAATLRERERLRRQVRTLSAEGRLSAWILGLLPIVFSLYLVFARPEYLSTLWSDPLGWLMIFIGVIMLGVGIVWLRKVVKIEV